MTDPTRDPLEAIRELRSCLEDIKNDFTQRTAQINARLQLIEKAYAQQADYSEKSAIAPHFSPGSGEDSSAIEPNAQAPGTDDVPKTDNKIIEFELTLPEDDETEASPPMDAEPAGSAETAGPPRKKSGLAIFLLTLLGPLGTLLERGWSVYRHYQAQGKAPVFLMTIAGITALILGFSFLLQYSFLYLLGDKAKIALGACVAAGVTFCGTRLRHRSGDMRDFGSSIIGLGIILQYLCCYFMTDYYELVSPLAGLLVYVLITGEAYIFALRYETRIIAVVTLIGGALVPLVAGNSPTMDVVGFYYLAILAGATLHLASRIRWDVLATVALVTSVLIIEVLIESNLTILSSAVAPSFALIFFTFSYFNVFDGRRVKCTLHQSELLRLCAVLVFFVLSLYRVLGDVKLLAAMYFSCAIPFAVVFIMSANGKKQTGGVLMLFACVLTGCGFFTLLHMDLWGALLAVEGAMLVYVGKRYHNDVVRIEGYFAYCIASLQIGYRLGGLLISGADLSFSGVWLSALCITGLMVAGEYMERGLPAHQSRIGRGMSRLIRELLTIWLSLLILFSVHIAWPRWIFVAGVIPLYILLYRAARLKSVFSETFALAHFLLLIIQVLISAGNAGNLHFLDQDLWGRIARIAAFLSLWGVAEMYSRHYSQSRFYHLAMRLREFFYLLIPLLYLPDIFRKHHAYFPLAVWGSALLNWVLLKRYSFKSLIVESKIMAAAAAIVTIGACYLTDAKIITYQAFPALMAGIVFFSLLLYLEKAFVGHQPKSSPFPFLFVAAFHFFCAAMLILVYATSRRLDLAILSAGACCYCCSRGSRYLTPLRGYGGQFEAVGFSAVAVLLVQYAFTQDPTYTTALLSTTGVVMAVWWTHQRTAHARLYRRVFGGAVIQMWMIHVMIFSLYILLSKQCFGDALGPATSIAIVLHATTILLLTLKADLYGPLLRLSILLFCIAALKIVLIDMAEFSMIQKIIALIIIGIVLLISAYQFQRLKSKLN